MENQNWKRESESGNGETEIVGLQFDLVHFPLTTKRSPNACIVGAS